MLLTIYLHDNSWWRANKHINVKLLVNNIMTQKHQKQMSKLKQKTDITSFLFHEYIQQFSKQNYNIISKNCHLSRMMMLSFFTSFTYERIWRKNGHNCLPISYKFMTVLRSTISNCDHHKLKVIINRPQ